MNVLIVEDNRDDLKLLRYTLEHHGCTVTEAHDGEEGLALADRCRPDIIVSDALMPRMDGFQLLRRLKADARLAQIPFLFYSAVYTGEAEEQLALSLGAEAFIVKPMEPEGLWEVIGKLADNAEPLGTRRPAINEQGEHLLLEYGRIVATKLEEKVRELEMALERQRKAEEALRQREQELATIFENAPFVMLLIDAAGEVRMVNDLACSFSGSASDEMLNRQAGEALRCLNAMKGDKKRGLGPSCPDCAIRQTVNHTFTTGKSCHQVETCLPVSRSGREEKASLLISTTPVRTAGETMVLLSLQDISDYKRVEAQLLHAQKMESIGTFAGGIAHDFNNILTAILGYGDMTLKSLPAESPLRQNIEYMLRAAHRAGSLSKDLLLFCRKQISDKTEADLNEIVMGIQKFLLRVIGEDIVCDFNLAPEALPILADPHQIEQVLMNLATNARDAMPKGGNLTISTTRVMEESLFSSLCSKTEFALLTVCDNGTGMDEDTCRQIFDPFFSTKEVGKGTGLGLAVVYGIIKHHDGFITVDSQPGQGTSFRVYLPFGITAENLKKSEPPPESRPGGSETILLAEDDTSVREMIASLLGGCGYQVITAADGEEAVRKYRENREHIRLLLFDVIMPNKNGIDAYEEIREFNPGIRAILATGYASEDIQLRIQTSDTVMQIHKPFQPTQLLAHVRHMLDRP